ncbi:MAG: VIT and VWA domain-containing protein [Phycisphaerales bacterium]|nr:VIT and VWA domain-containing protein [Phycisphaerales bacterium]
MNHFSPVNPDEPDAGPPPADELDALLNAWHEENADRARQGRNRLLHELNKTNSHAAPSRLGHSAPSLNPPSHLRRFLMTRLSPVAAAVVILAALITFFSPNQHDKTYASNVVLVPEGGLLNAVDDDGRILGPCPLKQTDVYVEISGRFSRVTVRQEYHNPFDDKIEAVYTFPLSHRAAVDSMTMTFEDRAIVGEVHERAAARAIYEAARKQGHVASLLEQERPNIFTQSVANIEPGVEIAVEISYVELLETKDGECSFTFPMVVGPRYIPSARSAPKGLPDEHMQWRDGLILLGPAELNITNTGETAQLGEATPAALQSLIENALPIDIVDAEAWQTSNSGEAPKVWQELEAEYAGTTREHITLYTNGTGKVGDRWFRFDTSTKSPGTGTAANTSRVPDAARITPRHVRPETRAGHDIAITVEIDSGGPGISDLDCPLHDTLVTDQALRADGLPQKTTLELDDANEIPNRDFVLKWRPVADEITEAVFTHTGDQGNFFTLMLQPPARVEPEEFVPRELVFVLDTSGSMNGWPIKKAKEVMSRAIDSMSTEDTFNVITFAGDTHILWDEPMPATDANIETAQAFLEGRGSGGGTEMMTAINGALEQKDDGPVVLSFRELTGLPVDGRDVVVKHTFYGDAIDPVNAGDSTLNVELDDGTNIDIEIENWIVRTGIIDEQRGLPVLFTGTWGTRDDEPIFEVDHAEWTDHDPIQPLRVVCFLTDGQVGNDMAIIDAVRRNAHTTRVFSFGIGNSTNRYLLNGMAEAGRGAVEYVLLEDDADAKIERFVQRIESPVLTNIELKFGDGLDVIDMMPAVIPDLYDEQPIILHGRYTTPGEGALTIRGLAGDGPYERVLDLELPESEPDHDVIATLWARSRVESIMNKDLNAAQSGRFPPELRKQVVDLGEKFGLMTQFTSFVAVEKFHVTIDGEPRLVPVPVELPDGMEFEGACGRQMATFARQLANAPQSIPAAVQRAHYDEMMHRQKEALIYVSIQVKAEEMIEHRAELLRSGTSPSDEEIRRLEYSIDRANQLLAEHGEVAPAIDPTIMAHPGDPLIRPRDPVDESQNAGDQHGRVWHQAVTTYKDLSKRVRVAILEDDHAEARRLLDFGRQAIEAGRRFAPSTFEYDDLQRQARELGVFVDRSQVVRERQLKAEEHERERIELLGNDKRQQIELLMNRALELRKERRFDEAIQVLGQVLGIDPNHDQAKWMQETLEDLTINLRDRAAHRHREAPDVLVEADEAGIPWHEDISYPKNWPEIRSKRLAPEEGQGTAVRVYDVDDLLISVPTVSGRRINLQDVDQAQSPQGALGGGRYLHGVDSADVWYSYTASTGDPDISNIAPTPSRGVISPDSSSLGQRLDPVTGLPSKPSQDAKPSLDIIAFDFASSPHLSYSYQFEHDPDRRIIGTNREPVFPLRSDGNPYRKSKTDENLVDSAARDVDWDRLNDLAIQTETSTLSRRNTDIFRSPRTSRFAGVFDIFRKGETDDGETEVALGSDFLGDDPKSTEDEASSQRHTNREGANVLLGPDIDDSERALPEVELMALDASSTKLADQETGRDRRMTKLRQLPPDEAERLIEQLSRNESSETNATTKPMPKVQQTHQSLPEDSRFIVTAASEDLAELEAIMKIAEKIQTDSTTAPPNEQEKKPDSSHRQKPIPEIVTRIYDVYDFRADATIEAEKATSALSTMDRLARRIQKAIAPDSWEANGGSGKVRVDQSRLVVTQSPDVHRAIHALLGRLRQARFMQVGLEPAVLEIVALVKIGEFEEAGARAEQLATARPNYEPAVKLSRLLDNRVLSLEHINEHIEQVRGEAAKSMKDKAEQVRTVTRRIDEPLLAFMSGAPAEMLGEPLSVRDGGVVVSLLTADKSAATMNDLKQAGLSIESKSESANLVIGVAPLSRLAAIALVDSVRRIEPIH